MSKKKDFGGFVYSTDPNYQPEERNSFFDNVSADKQVLRIWLERGKGGKEAI